MLFEQLKLQLVNYFNKAPLLLIGAGLNLGCLLGALVLLLVIQRLDSKNSSSNTLALERSTEINTILVDLSGAAANPGIYELQQNARLIDLLQKAKGLHSQADRYYFAKNFNLAQKLADGEKIYLPFLDENQYNQTPLANQKKTNLNKATQTELELLPGVGPVSAKKIISLRPYSEINELVTKKAVSQTVFNKIASLIQL